MTDFLSLAVKALNHMNRFQCTATANLRRFLRYRKFARRLRVFSTAEMKRPAVIQKIEIEMKSKTRLYIGFFLQAQPDSIRSFL